MVTLFTATLMHRLAPHCSFARWLLCNGSLFRYIHPSEEELRALAGKPRPRGRKERWANSLHDEKPLSVPRDAHFQLETCPLTAVDALGNTLHSPQSPPQLLGHSAQGELWVRRVWSS